MFFSVNANVVFKETPGLIHPYFVIAFRIFWHYCSRKLIFVGSYFGLIFRNIRESIFANYKRFFIINVLIRNIPESLKFEKLLRIKAGLTSAP